MSKKYSDVHESPKIYPYHKKYAREMVDIYYNTIHKVNIKDYSQEQVEAWTPKVVLELDGWLEKWSKIPPIVACINDIVVGFAEFEDSGYIDCFYVHHEYQGKGIGGVLMREILKQARDKEISSIYVDVSITAKPFFEHKGFVVACHQELEKRGVLFENYRMEKQLGI